MAADYVIVMGDSIMWMNSFGMATTLAPPTGFVTASASVVKVTKKPVALDGDEKNWMSLPVPYTAGNFSIPGVGIAKVMMLGADQKTQTSKFEGKPAIIKGSNFTAVLMVMVPAMMVTPAGATVPDPMPMHMGGMGKFINTNMVVKAA